MSVLSLDEDLEIQENRWRGRLITFGVAAIIAAIAAAAAYLFFFNSSAAPVRPTEDLKVARKTINSTLIISGVADAQLNSNLVFQGSGKVAYVSVKPGDVVKQGDVLASLESDDQSNAVAQARANQATAQLKLDNLLAGSTDAELAAADQAVASAEAGVTKAKNDQAVLLEGAKPGELATAQQAVDAANAQVATALANQSKLLDAPTDADVAAAQAAVAAAQSALTAAENNETSAQTSQDSSEASLKIAENAYCALDATPAFCGTRAAPISSADFALMQSSAQTQQASQVVSANTAYQNATNAASTASASVTSAQEALTSAQKKLSTLRDGASDADRAAAQAAVASAQAGLTAATKKLGDLQDGATPEQIANAQAAVDSAESTLAASQAKRAEAVRGADQNTIAQARQAVATAALTVEAAQIRLRNAQIVAPFDGTVAAVNAKPGEFFGAASTGAAIVLLTPDALTFKMSIGETDYASIKQGQGGVVIFDGVPGKPYPFSITDVGLSPTVTQGVVTYDVKASLVILPGSPRPAPGMNARGQITTDSRPNVLVLPPRAIRRRGNDQVVDLRRNGAIEEQVVTTGATDTESVEVLTGLAEGDTVVVPSLTSGANAPKAQATLPGGVR